MTNKLKAIIAKKKNGKKRFTLIEMLIVVFIIAALVAIFVPTFGVFHKADGTSLNANAKNVETAVFQYQMANQGVMPVADSDTTTPTVIDPVDMTVAANQFDEIDAVLTQAIKDATGVTQVNSQFLAEFKKEALHNIDGSAKKYVKGSGFDLDEFFIVADKLNMSVPVDSTNDVNNIEVAGTQMYAQELSGFIFSERTVVDSDGVIYNGTVTVK